MITVLALATLNFALKGTMQPARYPAASPIADTQALGGHGTSNNFPKPIGDKLGAAGKLSVVLSHKDAMITVAIRNRNSKEEWLPAHDGNLIGHLEARYGNGAWRPIEYHMWASCGNSRHRVAVPSSQGFTYNVAILAGKTVAQVRWTIQREGAKLVSNTLDVPLQASKFDLPAELAKDKRVHTEWGYAALAPKGM